MDEAPSALRIVVVILSIASLAVSLGLPLILFILNKMSKDISRLFEITAQALPKLENHNARIETLERAVERRQMVRREST